jgi:molybdopterin-guanine dinucleotide biosynthesis protein A
VSAAATPLAIVLAGGRSRRMGAPKAGVLLGGRPLVAWALEAAAGAGLEAVIVAKLDTELPDLGVPVWLEPGRPSHPLTGIVAALDQTAPRAVVALACDMPFVPAGLIGLLAELDLGTAAGAAAARPDGRPRPFPARYEQSALSALRAGLEREAAVREVLAELSPALIGAEQLAALGDPERMLTSLNDPAALARAEASLEG